MPGQPAAQLGDEARISIFSHLFIAETSQAAREELLPAYAAYIDQTMRRHRGQGMPRAAIDWPCVARNPAMAALTLAASRAASAR